MKPGGAFLLRPRLTALQLGSRLHLQLLLAASRRFFVTSRTAFFLCLALFSCGVVTALLFIVGRVTARLILGTRLFDLDLGSIRQRIPALRNHRISGIDPGHYLCLISASNTHLHFFLMSLLIRPSPP